MGQSLAAWRDRPFATARCEHPLSGTLLPLLEPYFASLRREYVIIAGCDDRQRLLSFVEHRGDAQSVDLVLPAIRRALAPERVSQLLLAHNHPCGSLMASQADREVTRRIAALARLAGVELADHLVFTGSGHASFRALGLL